MNLANVPAIFQQIQELHDRGNHLEMLVQESEEIATFYFERNRKLTALLSAINSKQEIDRKTWNMIRESLFWEIEVPSYTEAQFKASFRMCCKTFHNLVSFVKFIEKQDTSFKKCIPVDKRVAVSIFYLASSAECRTVPTLFGVGRSTLQEIVLEFCEAVCTKLESECSASYPPTDDSIKELTHGFEHKWGFPQIYGAVDGCHIKVSPPKDDATDYYNYKGWYSVVLLAAVDYRYRFTYVNVGSPGKSNDSYIFEKSKLKNQHKNNELFYKHSRTINGVSIPVMLLGDSAFRLSSYLMKPYPGNNLSPTCKHFNYMLSRSRRVVENAFGHLKGRFRKIGRGLQMLPENACLIIKACCILHNYLNNRNELINSTVQEDQAIFPLNQPTHTTIEGENNLNATTIRNSLAQYLYTGRRLELNAELGVDDEVEGSGVTSVNSCV